MSLNEIYLLGCNLFAHLTHSDAAPLIHRELDQFQQAGLSVVTKAIVPIIHAHFVRILWQVLHPTVLICPPMKAATSAVGLYVALLMVRLAQTVFLLATIMETGEPATATPIAEEIMSSA